MSQPRLWSMSACVGVVSPEITMARSGVSNRKLKESTISSCRAGNAVTVTLRSL